MFKSFSGFDTTVYNLTNTNIVTHITITSPTIEHLFHETPCHDSVCPCPPFSRSLGRQNASVEKCHQKERIKLTL